jgi:hypothetical protein
MCTYHYHHIATTKSFADITSCKALPLSVALKPGKQLPIASPNLSGIASCKSVPGMTNATMTFKYEIEAK